MKRLKLTEKHIKKFENYLIEEEKSTATIEKYLRDVNAFFSFSGSEIDKNTVIAYKNKITLEYAPRSVNSMLASLNAFFSFLGLNELKVKALKLQQQIYCPEEKELTKAEYVRLCRTAERNGDKKLSLIIQTICGTGIRVSELKFITVEAVKSREATVNCKGKRRPVFIVKELQKKLLRYIREQGITSGSVFVTRTGNPVSRTNIWREMKDLCTEAGVNPSKVFPQIIEFFY